MSDSKQPTAVFFIYCVGVHAITHITSTSAIVSASTATVSASANFMKLALINSVGTSLPFLGNESRLKKRWIKINDILSHWKP